MTEHEAILALLYEAKKLAQAYRRLTGKPFGITGEVAEYEAARILGIELTALGRQVTMLLRGRTRAAAGLRSRAGVHSTTANLGSASDPSELRKSGTLS